MIIEISAEGMLLYLCWLATIGVIMKLWQLIVMKKFK